ncbi:MAG: AbrB/MazE/SpoVT family DNA-binding domain-containing protein [Spirochaetaceae bacterium]|nr:AbrB/MazE/SpoVT family DNA-binding domain-containing protein [Spirochaetaceae bacterium]
MRSTIDRAGRIVVPKPIREAANLRPGTVVEFRVQGGHVEIEPLPLTVSLQRRGSLVVAVPEADQLVMRAADVDETLAQLRDGSGEQDPVE